jgi:hypothetical protein
VVRGQDHHGNPAAGQVLLVPEALVRRDQDIEPGALSFVQEAPVFHPVPAHLVGRLDFMAGQNAAQT